MEGNMHYDCYDKDKVHCISTTLNEIQKQLKIHAKSVFSYFSTDEEDHSIICIESYDQENNIKKTYFSKNCEEYVFIFSILSTLICC